jgi:predicted amidohydrolase
LQSLEACAERRLVVIIMLPLLTEYTQEDTQKNVIREQSLEIIQMQAKKDLYDTEVEEEELVWKTCTQSTEGIRDRTAIFINTWNDQWA